MNKQQILNQVQSGLKEGVIKPEDLNTILRLYNLSIPEAFSVKTKSGLDFGKIFSLVGGLVVFLGFASLVGLYWRDMNSAMRVVATLGVGLTIFSIGSYVIMHTKQRFTGLALHLIPPILINSGLSILIFDVIMNGSNSSSSMLLSSFLINLFIFVLYLGADIWISSQLFSFVAWFGGTSAYWYSILFVLNRLQISDILLFENRIFAVFGLIYCVVMAGILHLTEHSHPKKFFNDIATFATSGYFLVNIFWFLYDKIVLESLFGLVLFLTIYLSVKLNKGAVLLSGIAGIVIYIGYMSSRYFQNTLGWPISIIIIGFGLIGSGYLFVNLKGKIHE